MSLDGMRQEGEGVAAPLAAGFHHRQHRLDEVTAVDALGAERESPPKDRVTQRAVVSRVARTANTVNMRATNVHNHALSFSCLVPVSSIFNCSSAGNWAASGPASWAGFVAENAR